MNWSRGRNSCARAFWTMLASSLAVTALSALTGCGGGGSSASAASPIAAPASTNVYAAYAALTRQPHNYSLAGSTSTGVALTATLSIAQGAPVTSNGSTFDTATLTTSIFNGGILSAFGVTTAWQLTGTPNWAATFNSSDGTCFWETSGSSLPTSASLGQSGAYITASQYSGCNATTLPYSYWIPVGKLTTTWSYSTINGTAFVCINSSNLGFVGVAALESDCIEVVDTAGTLGTHVRISTQDLNKVVTVLAN